MSARRGGQQRQLEWNLWVTARAVGALVAFKPESSNMFKFISLEDYPDDKKQNRLEERNDITLNFDYLVSFTR